MTLRKLILKLVHRLNGSIPVWMLTKEECPPRDRALALLAAAGAQGFLGPARPFRISKTPAAKSPDPTPPAPMPPAPGPAATTPDSQMAKVTITVNEAHNQTTNTPCYAVTLTTDETPPRTATFPVDDLEEAKALAESFKRFVEIGCDVEALLG
jgi:hypothetical protein